MLHKGDSRIAGTGNLKKILVNLKFDMFLPILQNKTILLLIHKIIIFV